jgi:hypothetical protein
MRDANNYKTGDIYDYWTIEGGLMYDQMCAECRRRANGYSWDAKQCTNEVPGRLCRGWSVRKTSAIARLMWYADNSLEVDLEDGTHHMALAPSGDACY